jgi:hypothetical protein
METINYTTKATRIVQAKPLNDIAIMTAVKPKRTSIEVLNSVCIRDGVAYVTDLELWGWCPAPAGLADGMYTIAGGCLNRNSQPIEDFPPCKLPDADIMAAVELPLGNVWAALEACRSRDILRPALCGVNLQMVPGTTYATATDGHKLVVRDLHAVPLMGEYSTILMPRLCDALYKMRGHGSALLHVTAEHQIVYIGAWTLAAPIVAGTYPSVERVFPAETVRHTTFNRAELIAALTALKPFATKATMQVEAWFNPDKLDDEVHGLVNVLWAVEDVEREFHKGATTCAAHCNGAQNTDKGERTLIMPIRPPEEIEENGVPVPQPAFSLNIEYLLSLLTTTEAATVRLDWTAAGQCFMLHFE